MNARSAHGHEIAAGERFEFGANWSRFLTVLDDERIQQAEKSLCQMLGVSSLAGKRFIDVGCGSGLFSLAARRLGATVVSFDFDPQSVACALALRSRFFRDDPDWKVMEASVLDSAFIKSLGQFDIVYSWGVLHHTGAMWDALANVSLLVAESGTLFISLYNDQGRKSRMWTAIKKLYVASPRLLRWPIILASYVPLRGPMMVRDFLHGKPFASFRNYKSVRGMSQHHDLVDWIGGYPFEVSKPEEIFDFYRVRGFSLEKLKTCGGGLGCNEFVFKRSGEPVSI